MEISDKEIQEIKGILEKDHGREFSWEEVRKAFWDIQSIAQVFMEISMSEFERQQMLKENPKGFHLEGKGTCLICGNSTSGEETWFDKFGLKCMICQNSINKKTIPASIAKNKDSWYSKSDLEYYFNIKVQTLKKYIKDNVLKARLITDKMQKPYFHIFLLRDNKDVLPPKNLLKSRIVKIMKDGEEYFTSENWYEYLDIKLAEKIKKYKIINYLSETFSKPIDTGRLFYKEISPLFKPKNFYDKTKEI